jgi:two-component system chemotaxis sensor kinase CheA
LVIRGESQEIDKSLVERLLDPLLRLVRNAVVHGIEPPQERVAAGKPPQGRLILWAQPEGERVLISVEDDGRGVDLQSVTARARAEGWISADQELSDELVLEWLCRPGFSTLEEADLSAGRGVGMDVVREVINAVGGNLWMKTQPGQGTIFTMQLPLTLMIIEALLVEVGSERYAVPQAAVERVIEIDPRQVVQVGRGELLSYRSGSLPLLRMSKFLRLPTTDSTQERIALVCGHDGSRVGLVVDRVVGMQEVVVRPVTDPLVAHRGFSGATELGDGCLVLIFHVPELVRLARQMELRR